MAAAATIEPGVTPEGESSSALAGAGAPPGAVSVPAEGPSSKPKKKRARAGTVARGGRDGKGPARPVGDGGTVRPVFDAGDVAERLDLWRLNEKGGGFMMRSRVDGGWMPLTRGELEAELECLGLPKGDKSQPVREVERVINHVQNGRRVDMVMDMAGHWPGVVKIDTLRILVRRAPELLVPVEGEWPVLRKVLEGMFLLPLEGPGMPPLFKVFVKGQALPAERALDVWRAMVRREVVANEERGEVVERWFLDQTVVFYSWLRLALEVYYRRAAGENVSRSGHALIIASEPDAGKSLLMGLLKKLLGGRRANVEQYLSGKTPFNADAMKAEMLSLSDAPLSTKEADRALLMEFIKETVAENEHRYHPKGQDASFMLPVMRRLAWVHNADLNNLRQVPPMAPELRDKVHWLRALAKDMPMPTTEIDDYMKFGRTLDEELPRFVWWLLNVFQVPEGLKGGRFGMVGVQDPGLVLEQQEDSAPAQFLELLDAARWELNGGGEVNFWDWMGSRTGEHGMSEDKRVWTGGHVLLKQVLTGEGCSLRGEFEGMLKMHRVDRLLSRLKKDAGDRVVQHRTKSARLWDLVRPLV